MILVEEKDGVALVRMQHGRANALDIEFCQALMSELAGLEPSAGAVVLTGRDRIFSAGIDLLRVLESGPRYLKQFLPVFRDFCQAVFSYPKPLVAAMNGHALAGGCILACMADLRLMARGSGRVGVPELLVGVPFPPTPLEIVRFAVPARHFAEVVYGGRVFEPEDGALRGLVDEIVEPASLLERAERSARELASLPPQTFRLTKEQIRRPALEQMQTRERALAAAVETIWTSPASLEAIRKYVDRTFKRSSS